MEITIQSAQDQYRIAKKGAFWNISIYNNNKGHYYIIQLILVKSILFSSKSYEQTSHFSPFTSYFSPFSSYFSLFLPKTPNFDDNFQNI